MAGADLPSFHGIIGRSPAMRELFRIIDLVADTDATVLIRGERGTGKELVAAAVHRLSRRGAAAFVPIDCGALPHDLLASELFGHERGAFTGAIEKRPGLFVVAHGGTLFADEIGNLSMEGQAKLLRAIEEREIRPVGARVATRVDVRLIAATNKDLKRAVRDNRSCQTSTTGWTRSCWRCHRSAPGARTFPCWLSTSSPCIRLGTRALCEASAVRPGAC
jgi:transcriptional regulator with GAF, ATPase, and Fis domain